MFSINNTRSDWANQNEYYWPINLKTNTNRELEICDISRARVYRAYTGCLKPRVLGTGYIVFPRLAQITVHVSPLLDAGYMVFFPVLIGQLPLLVRLLIKLVYQFHDSRTKKPVVENQYIQLTKC